MITGERGADDPCQACEARTESRLSGSQTECGSSRTPTEALFGSLPLSELGIAGQVGACRSSWTFLERGLSKVTATASAAHLSCQNAGKTQKFMPVRGSHGKIPVYALYAPPNHRDGVVHHTRDDAKADNEHFDGKTTE